MIQKEYTFDASYQPQVRTKTDTSRIMLDVIIALVPAMLVSILMFGWKALMLIAVSVAASVFFEWGYRKIMNKPDSIHDLSACVTGILIAMVVPVSAKWWMVVVGDFFAIVIVKQLYGGLGKNFVNPALAARAFMMASWAAIMTTWTLPKGVDAVSAATPLSYLFSGTEMPFTTGQLFLGSISGCIGEVSAAALLLGGIYLLVRKVINWRIPVGFIGTVAVLTLIFGHEGYGNVDFMLRNLLSGGLFLGAFFMATDYVTSPITKKGQILYGILLGCLTGLFRIFGGSAEGVSYAIIFSNLLVPLIERITIPKAFGKGGEK